MPLGLEAVGGLFPPTYILVFVRILCLHFVKKCYPDGFFVLLSNCSVNFIYQIHVGIWNRFQNYAATSTIFLEPLLALFLKDHSGYAGQTAKG